MSSERGNCSKPCRGCRSRRVDLVASSANVYGNAREGVSTRLPPAPANDYGVSKVAMEHIARTLRVATADHRRSSFNYTGRGQSELPHAQDRRPALQRAPVIELGNLDVARDFSDVRTVAETYARLLETPRAIGGTFNICSGRAVSLNRYSNW